MPHTKETTTHRVDNGLREIYVPARSKVRVATNLPDSSPIKYWLNDVPDEYKGDSIVERHIEVIGIGFSHAEVELDGYEQFETLYAAKLAKAIKDKPGAYGSQTPESALPLARKMTRALWVGSSHVSDTVKKVCKELRIKPTAASIKEYLINAKKAN